LKASHEVVVAFGCCVDDDDDDDDYDDDAMAMAKGNTKMVSQKLQMND